MNEHYIQHSGGAGVWVSGDVPVLTHHFAGIGSRAITPAGIRAIADVYRNTFRDKTF